MSSFIPAAEYAADTMAIVLRFENRRTSLAVEQIFDAADASQTVVHIPAVVFAEILYLSEKNRIALTLADVAAYLRKFPAYRPAALNFEIVERAGRITDIPELHDRLIAPNANYLNIELLTNDPKIENSAFARTVW